MVLTGKITGQFQTKSDRNQFYELFKLSPSTLSNLVPGKVRGVDLLQGVFGALGCVMFWKYVLDGREQESKSITEAVDELKKSITFKIVEGDVMQLYKTFVATVSFDTLDVDNNYVTWTIEFEKLNEDVPEPYDILEFALGVCKDIETQGLLQLLGIKVI